MAIKLVEMKYRSCMDDCVKKYIVDEDADLENLPKSAPSSYALCPKTGKMKSVNASGEWVDFGEG